MTISISKLSAFSTLSRRLATLAAVALLVAAMGGTWTRSASAAPPAQPAPVQQPVTKPSTAAVRPTAGTDAEEAPAKKTGRKQITGKLNLNTANEEQLMLLPTVGPSKAERIIAWRAKNGGFKRTADLRRVKGFGYKTFKKLEAFLDIKGDTTLVAQQ
jgi:competence ComEA-like helix-hairpin-helix protein